MTFFKLCALAEELAEETTENKDFFEEGPSFRVETSCQ